MTKKDVKMEAAIMYANKRHEEAADVVKEMLDENYDLEDISEILNEMISYSGEHHDDNKDMCEFSDSTNFDFCEALASFAMAEKNWTVIHDLYVYCGYCVYYWDDTTDYDDFNAFCETWGDDIENRFAYMYEYDDFTTEKNWIEATRRLFEYIKRGEYTEEMLKLAYEMAYTFDLEDELDSIIEKEVD